MFYEENKIVKYFSDLVVIVAVIAAFALEGAMKLNFFSDPYVFMIIVLVFVTIAGIWIKVRLL